MPDSHPLLLRAADIEKEMQPFRHPWNPNSEAFGVVLGHRLGLALIGEQEFEVHALDSAKPFP